MGEGNIIVRGARQHNLKNVTLEIPRNKFVVITGVSGSGKSSLAFDTLYAEGQRRYIESLSAYARQFLGQMDKPEVDSIDGLSPAIAIEQRAGSRNPRSTVGTVTEVHDYLRLLFARIGVPHCPKHGVEITPQSVDRIVSSIQASLRGQKVEVIAPVLRGKKGEHRDLLEDLRRQGFRRVLVDGVESRLGTTTIKLEKNKKHTIEAVVDAFVASEDEASRLSEAIELGQRLGGGVIYIGRPDGSRTTYSLARACPSCGFSLEELEPRLFSFNAPFGACRGCSGIGATLHADPGLILRHPDRPVTGGAFSVAGIPVCEDCLRRLCRHFHFDPSKPVSSMPERAKQALLYGAPEGIAVHWHCRHLLREGVANVIERRFKETKSSGMRDYYMDFMTFTPCHDCGGKRLKPEVLAVTVRDRSIAAVSAMSVEESLRFFRTLAPTDRERTIVGQVVKEILSRLGFLENVGLTYLTLDRAAGTLSGGEAERISLATQIGSGLVGVLYILDEPSIGLHPRDHDRLLSTLASLRDLGNTVVVVEHDEATMRHSDWLIDLGPGAGVHGGELLFAGPPSDVGKAERSLTADYLLGRRAIPLPARRERGKGLFLEVHGARENNLKGIQVKFPLGTLTGVSGVSGSGKSTLVQEILYKALRRALGLGGPPPGKHDYLQGVDHLDRVLMIDQSPIGRTPRSNPATYTGLFTPIRELFAQLPEAQARGFAPGRFSFNVAGGRCEACEGDGIIRHEMHFLPDVYVVCEVCHGKRFNQETLAVAYKGKNVADVLKMTVDEALAFFAAHPRIHARLQLLSDVGLGYVELGQSATTLSGGEAQRIKIAFELSKVPTGKTLYLLDEPTTGLHFDDVRRLLEVLFRLRESGNTVVVIEHNLDVLKSADWLIDLGPEGGDKGGELVAAGTPEEVAKVAASHTGRFLRPLLSSRTRNSVSTAGGRATGLPAMRR
ncbi:MAG: excinuclease ABC subunit UvrA [Euryarchaeota archaeon]|nr:excinuclease ABC subunit UvrA [Euryarchaeota archaeon]MDE1880813.1 excinuclease ABC subunit UvrA [Euryarchaeota archaeon]